MSTELKELLKEAAAGHGFEFFGVVDARKLAEVPFPPHRCLDVPESFLPGARSVIVLGMHVWDVLQTRWSPPCCPTVPSPSTTCPDRSTTTSTTN